MAYSMIGYQTAYLATKFNPVYWDTACLIVNSGAINESSTDYGKIAKAIGEIRAAGVNIALPDINESDLIFKPDAKNNKILYGLKGMTNVTEDIIPTIIQNRPYKTVKDFYNKCKPKRQVMVALIKGGAFDNLMNRTDAMIWYLWTACDKKSRITLQNMPALVERQMLPEETKEEYQIYEFNRYLKAMCGGQNGYYMLDTRAIDFLTRIQQDEKIQMVNDELIMSVKNWDNYYQRAMDIFRKWMSEEQKDILENLNYQIFLEDWMKYAGKNNYSAWEMYSLGFYYHKHELANARMDLYGVQDFNKMSTVPPVDYTFETKDGKTINMYKLTKIWGTCIKTDKIKSIVTLLTPTGVVDVKFNKEFFAMYHKRISQRLPNGKKTIVEKSFFEKGSMIMVLGMRQDDMFYCKKYKSYSGHRLYKIEDVNPDGTVVLRSERAEGELSDEED